MDNGYFVHVAGLLSCFDSKTDLIYLINKLIFCFCFCFKYRHKLLAVVPTNDRELEYLNKLSENINVRLIFFSFFLIKDCFIISKGTGAGKKYTHTNSDTNHHKRNVSRNNRLVMNSYYKINLCNLRQFFKA